ncbi:hypothetical protein FK535_26290 [Mycolicibacterium sp. 018/SC-01/001]|uniref:hypothetical protein n=1 Tax=Mycolicibacterium sp. 018/SC-01/001 TaxID=2592069 RepID=UPI00118151FA|nr:hypothetical protein [Mycolicibacterium sp. 018/SC-01/001]TRW77902.1 hypothetical protein FK535_26290 [Mycolicibacterium sp. 018/SC-01/001]
MAPAQLTDPSIRRDLQVLLVSEIGGVETFATAHRAAKDSADRTMWEVLHALEVTTKAAVYDNLGDIAEQVMPWRRTTEALGTTNGAGLALLPHHMQMRALTAATKLFLPRFEKLHNHFHGTDLAPFFAFVVAHEKAIAEVGRRGLAGRDDVLAPVEALLQQGAP